MTVLHIPDGKTLGHLVAKCPSISTAVLIYRWIGKSAIAEKMGMIIHYEYDEIDWEYSYIGDRDGLLNFAARYSVWDDPDVKFELRDGILYGDFGMCDPGCDEDGTPDPRIRRGSLVSADNVRIVRIEPLDSRAKWVVRSRRDRP